MHKPEPRFRIGFSLKPFIIWMFHEWHRHCCLGPLFSQAIYQRYRPQAYRRAIMRTKIAVFVGLLLSLGTTAFGQNLPALPVIPDISCTSTATTLSNQTISVPAGGNFQTAI